MERLFEWAKAKGVRKVVGQILSDNAPMLAFVRRLGFSVRRSAEEEDVMVAEREIAA
jgi:acetyltransferase